MKPFGSADEAFRWVRKMRMVNEVVVAVRENGAGSCLLFWRDGRGLIDQRFISDGREVR